MLLVPAGTAQSRLASLVVAAAQETTPAGRGVGCTQRCAGFAHWLHRRLPSPPTSVARQQPGPRSVSTVYSALPLSRLQGALRCATTLFCPLPTTALPNSGLLVVHQRCLEDGASRCLHRLESNGPPNQPAFSRQPQPLSDSALGPRAEPGQPYPLVGGAPTAPRLAGRVSRSARAVGNTGGWDALSRRLLSRRQLDRGGPHARPRPHGFQRKGARSTQAHLPVSAPPPLAGALVRPLPISAKESR